jgi:outer membrane protein assembly factor BamB
MRLDRSGNKLWEQTFGGTGYHSFQNMEVTSDRGCVLIGNDDDYWVVRLDQNGNKVWEKSLGERSVRNRPAFWKRLTEGF